MAYGVIDSDNSCNYGSFLFFYRIIVYKNLEISCINCDSRACEGFTEHVYQQNSKCFCVIRKYNE